MPDRLSLSNHQVAEVAHHMALLPLLWLAILYLAGHRRGQAWWWLGGAFAVSWLADTAVDFGAPKDLVSLMYPVSQATIVGAVFLDRQQARWLLLAVCATALVATTIAAPHGKDVLLRSVAYGSVTGIVLDRPALGWLRLALLTYFGLGLLTWFAYAREPSVIGWYLNQTVRLIGLTVFGRAAWWPLPSLKVAL